MKKVYVLAGLVVVGAAVLACAGGSGTIEPGTTAGSSGSSGSNPTQEQEISVPPGLSITATFVAATLGDDCADKGARFADCAPGADCGGFCQQTNMQLRFKSTGGSAATVEIASVTLRDASGTDLQTLTPRNPRSWTGNAYGPWDQSVAGGAEVKASYDLSAPSWSTIDPKGSYSAKYRLRIHIKVNGQSLTIESTDLSREPAVVT